MMKEYLFLALISSLHVLFCFCSRGTRVGHVLRLDVADEGGQIYITFYMYLFY